MDFSRSEADSFQALCQRLQATLPIEAFGYCVRSYGVTPVDQTPPRSLVLLSVGDLGFQKADHVLLNHRRRA